MPSGDGVTRADVPIIDGNIESGSIRYTDPAKRSHEGVCGHTVNPGRRLKILLICHWFPPSNVIGAVRVGHFAKSLHDAGHDVRVLTGETSGDQSLPVPLPADRITYVRAKRRGESLGSVIRFARRSASGATSTPSATPQPRPQTTAGLASLRGRWISTLRLHYRALLYIPDQRAPWMHRVTAAGYRLVKRWRPDIILASGPPHSGLIAAMRIAKVCDAPWVADLRDLWVDDPYYFFPRWRLWLDQMIEGFVLKSTAALITVSPIWADMFCRKYRQPVACILNGFIAEDFPALPSSPERGEVVSILYTGNIYVGRDPTPLFRAMGMLTRAELQHVAVHFYGPSNSGAQRLLSAAAAAGVADRVFLHDRVSYQESLSLQQSADVLLLLQGDKIKDAGNIPAKFFEYLGARRPILLLGHEHGNLAEMIRERSAGLVANDPAIIAEQLRHWIGQRPVGIPAIPATARDGMSRADQYRKLEQLFAQVLS